MRKKEKEITLESELETIIGKATICRLGLMDGEQPYIVPLCFGYQDKTLYFHGAREGKKLDLIRRNPRVGFEMDINTEIKTAEDPCNWGMRYQSIIGCGLAFFVEDFAEKQQAIEIIMRQYTNQSFHFAEAAIHKITVLKVKIEKMTGKQSG